MIGYTTRKGALLLFSTYLFLSNNYFFQSARNNRAGTICLSLSTLQVSSVILHHLSPVFILNSSFLTHHSYGQCELFTQTSYPLSLVPYPLFLIPCSLSLVPYPFYPLSLLSLIPCSLIRSQVVLIIAKRCYLGMMRNKEDSAVTNFSLQVFQKSEFCFAIQRRCCFI